MTLTPLGDRAWLATCADEATAIRLSLAVRDSNPDWLEDVVPAYSTVGIYYDGRRTNASFVNSWLKSLKIQSKSISDNARSIVIPVCYEHGPDLTLVANQTRLSVDDVIRLHTTSEFAVFAIGFVPGFPYLGYLPKELSGVPRLATPRARVEPGSVGLTGRQTGIYPLARPGGWHLIGRTPLTIVDVEDRFFPICVGDRIRFQRIDDSEFARLNGNRLSTTS